VAQYAHVPSLARHLNLYATLVGVRGEIRQPLERWRINTDTGPESWWHYVADLSRFAGQYESFSVEFGD